MPLRKVEWPQTELRGPQTNVGALRNRWEDIREVEKKGRKQGVPHSSLVRITFCNTVF